MASPMISVVIPARVQTVTSLSKVLQALERQVFIDFEVIIVCDRFFGKVEWEYLYYWAQQHFTISDRIRFFSHLNSDFVPKSAGGASYVRNFGIMQSRGEFVLLLDDDNSFDAEYLALCMHYYQEYAQKLDAEVVLTPTLMWRDSEIVQNNGFSSYNYALARPNIFFLPKGQEYAEIQMYSGNGVFGKKELFAQTLYDEQIAWIAEDLDFVYRLHKKGAKILTHSQLVIFHWERDKSFLEKKWIATPLSIQQKIRNIFIRNRKHANFWQKVLFRIWSSRGITLRLAFSIMISDADNKLDLLRALGGEWTRQYFKC